MKSVRFPVTSVCVVSVLALALSALPAAAVTTAGATVAGVTAAPAEGDEASSTSSRRGEPVQDRTAPVEAPAAGDTADHAPDRVLVRFEPDTTVGEQRQVLESAGAAAVAAPETSEFVPVDVGDRSPEQVLAELDADPGVAEVQLDQLREASWLPDDPHLSRAQDHLDLIAATRAWDVASGAGTRIAVVDDGVRADHPDLVGAVLPAVDVLAAGHELARGEHGTAVAQVAAARADNGTGIAGIAHDAQILPVRAMLRMSPEYERPVGYDSDIARGIRTAADMGVDVVNLSLGGYAESPVLLEAIRYAIDRGAVVVAAAGNQHGQRPQYPAAYAPEVPGLLAVGVTDSEGWPLMWSTHGDWISVAAPGHEILTPDVGGSLFTTTGSSMAAAFVSGVAAMLAEQHPDWSAARIAEQITRTAREAGPRGVDPYYGHGVLDAAAAVGLTPSVPFDRVPDASSDSRDDVPAGATPLTVDGTWATGRGVTDGEGDVDWFLLPAGEPGLYRATVNYDQHWPGDPVTVVDADGRRLPMNPGFYEVEFQVPSAGPLRLAVNNSDSVVPKGPYTFEVERIGGVSAYGRVRFDGGSGVPLGECGSRLDVRDVTGDGLVDLVTTSDRVKEFEPVVKARMLTLFVGGPGGSFRAGLSVELGRASPDRMPSGHALADLDGDGVLDVVVGTTSGPRLFTARGGTLVDEGSLGEGLGRTAWLAAGDLEGDGDVDVVTRSAQGTSVHVLRRLGDGTFAGSSVDAPGSDQLELADVDEDGRLDLVTSGGAVRQQRPDGSFADPVLAPGMAGSRWFALADVDADAHLDLVALDGAGTLLHHARGRGDGTFHAPALVGAPSDGPLDPEVPLVADVNGDGLLDVVRGRTDTSIPVGDRVVGGMAVWIQRPDGTFREAQEGGAHHLTETGAAVHDVDADGDADLLACWYGRLTSFGQSTYNEPVPAPEFVWDVTPTKHTAGLGTRPMITLTTHRSLVDGVVDDRTVRLLDGATGEQVPATATAETATGRIRLVPTVDLRLGHHYQVTVSGLADETGMRQDGVFRSWFTVGAGGDRFTPIDPYRVLDTRLEGGPVAPGAPLDLEVGGVHVPPEATAVVLNVTAVNASGLGNIRVYPAPAGAGAPPQVSNLNVTRGVDQPNMVTVRLGTDGMVRMATDGMSADVVADIAGYYSPGAATGYVPLAPVRVMDTRVGAGGVPPAPVRAGRWVDLVVTGRHGVPADAAAVVLNVTGVNPDGRTNVRVYPAPEPDRADDVPTVSTLNLQPGRDQPNLATIRVGDGGRVRFYTQTADVHLVADLAGYYSTTGDRGFVPLEPYRAVDSRVGRGLPGSLAPGRTVATRLAGTGQIPSTADAAVLNVTAASVRGQSNVRVFPTTAAGTVPHVSNLNVVAGRDDPNQAIVRFGENGAVSFFSETAGLDLVVDVAGYFTR